jgi:hypothetical protein
MPNSLFNKICFFKKNKDETEEFTVQLYPLNRSEMKTNCKQEQRTGSKLIEPLTQKNH